MNEKFTMVFGGDINTHNNKTGTSGANAKKIMAEVAAVTAGADYAIANLENPLLTDAEVAPIVKSGPCLYGWPENADLVRAGGFDAVCLANNHFGDHGTSGMHHTFANLQARGIPYFGAGETIARAYEPLMIDQNGLRTAVIGMCENEFGGASRTEPGSAVFAMGRAYHAIRRAKESADFVVVFFHGGNEQNPYPSPRTVERYRLFVEFGADAVIAGHTHCMQGAEYYHGAPIVYSMGNLYFPTLDMIPARDAWSYGYLTRLTLEKGAPARFELLPYRQEPDGVTLLQGAQRARVLHYLDELSAPLADDAELDALAEGWSMIAAGYTDFLTFGFHPEGLANDEERQRAAYVLNNFQCEAHNDMLRTLFRVQYAQRIPQAEVYRRKIEQMQKIPVDE